MDEEPLFHRAKWTPNDRQCLMQEIERGGDWVQRGAEHLGRSPGAALREARRMADMGMLPARLRSDIYAARLQHERKPAAITPARRERMAASFEALTGHPIREVVIPKEARRRAVPEYVNVKSTDDMPERPARWDRFWRWVGRN